MLPSSSVRPCAALTAAENDIDGEALVLLDDASLRDLGVTSIGHRMTLLSEIFQLKQTHGIQIEPGDWVPQSTSSVPPHTAYTDYESVPDDVPDITTLLRERGTYRMPRHTHSHR